MISARDKSAYWHFVAMGTILFWGTSFVSTKVLLNHDFSAVQIFNIRFFVTYLILLAASHKQFFCKKLKEEILLVICGIAGCTIYFWTENTALLYSQACNVSFLVCTTPLLTSLLAYVLGKDRMTRYLAIGSAVALVGMAMVVFNGQHELHLSPKGDFLAIGAALCWAFYSNFMPGILDKYESSFATRKIFIYGLIAILPVFVFRPWSASMEVLTEPVVASNLLFLAVVASLGCFALWNPVMKNLGIMASSNYLYLNPVFTLFGSILVLGEKVTVVSGIGSAIILAGVIIAGRSSKS